MGFHIAEELSTTRRPCVLVDVESKKVGKFLETFSEHLFVEGDGTDNDTLRQAGIEKAAGLFAATGDGIEEVELPPSFPAASLREPNLRRHPNVLLLAVRYGASWAFNPPDEHPIRPGQTLVFMTTPGERKTLESLVTDMT